MQAVNEEVDGDVRGKAGGYYTLDVCKLTRQYRRAHREGNADEVLKVFQTEGLAEALEYFTTAWGCAQPGAWKPCHKMEFLMGRQTPGHENC